MEGDFDWIDRMLRTIREMPPTDITEKIDRDLAEFDAKVKRGDLPRPDTWDPKLPEQFLHNPLMTRLLNDPVFLEQLSEEEDVLQPSGSYASSPLLQLPASSLVGQIRDKLLALVNSDKTESLANAQFYHRFLVDEIQQQLYGQEMNHADAMLFLEAAAEEIRLLIIERAKATLESSKTPNPDDTVLAQSPFDTTLTSAAITPTRALKQMEILQSLPQEDARYYRLVQLSGRTIEEVADLLGESAETVLERTKTAITMVTFDA